MGLLVALGCGLLIGLERERRKGQGDDRQAAGLRSFTVAAMTGAIAQASGQPGLVAAGAILVALLSALAYFKSRSRDPGLTTELALFTTYLIGVTAVSMPALGAACAAGLAALLAGRQRLHHFATRVLSEQELHDGLLLAALALVVLPLIPSSPLAWLGGINPRPLAALVLLILVLQAVGHVALRLLGPGRGLVASGFFSGFVSSTATIASLGSRVPRGDAVDSAASVGLLAAAAVLSTAATWIQVMVMSAALSPAAARALAPLSGAGLAAALAVGMVIMIAAGRGRPLTVSAADPSVKPAADPSAPPAAEASPRGSALRVREALLVAGLLSVVVIVVTLAQQRFGQAGLFSSVALAGLADAHAPVASLAALFAGGGLGQRELVLGVLIAVSSNSVVRLATAFIAGGPAFGLRVGAGLLGGLAAAWAIGVLVA